MLIYGRHLLILLILFFSLLPLFYVILASFKSMGDPMQSLIFKPIIDNYLQIVKQFDFFLYLRNTVFITVMTVVICALVGIPAAYGLSRFQFFGKRMTLFFILLVRFLPYILFILPLFMLMTRIGLVKTFPGLILAYITVPLPILIWLMKGFFDDIPVDTEEAALIDGASRFQAFLRVVLPAAAPGIASITILIFIIAWNQFLIPLIIAGYKNRTLIIGLTQFMGGETWGHRLGLMSAWSIAVIIPVIIIALAVNKYLVRGFTQGID